MVNRRHAVGRREVERKNQSQDDTDTKASRIKEGNGRWKWWGQ